MGLFTVASERARLAKLKAAIVKIEDEVETFDHKVENEFEDLFGTHHTEPAPAPAPLTATTTGTASTPLVTEAPTPAPRPTDLPPPSHSAPATGVHV